MIKETSNKQFNPIRFNEHVNAILLIMFLTVAIILSTKGCGTCFVEKNQNIKKVMTEKGNAKADSTMTDSTIAVQ